MTAVPMDPLNEFVEQLQSKETTTEKRIQIYQTITSYMKDGDSQKFDTFVTQLLPLMRSTFQCLKADFKSDQPEVAQTALQTLGFCLFQDDVTSHITKGETESILNTLCEVVIETTEKNTCTRALWCLSKQTFKATIVEKQIEQVVNAIEHGQCKKKFQSMTVEHEAVNALIRLIEQVPSAMESYAAKWGPLIYGPLVHAAQVVREKALIAMEKGYPHMLSCQEELAKRLAADLKAQVLISELNRLMKSGQESHVLNVWIYYVKLLGKALHSGSLINHMLPIVEQGFKNPNPKVKVQSYAAWEVLIDNFALNPDIIGDHKRVKLLMQVFRINNAKYESVASAKLSAWWHFVLKLGEKTTQYFDQVCVPLLHYCVNGVVSPTGLTPGGRTGKHASVQRIGGKFGSPNTPHLNITNVNSPGLTQTFKSVQLRGQEVVAQFIGRSVEELDNPKPRFAIVEVKNEIIKGIHFFLKHHQTLIGAITQGIISIGNDVEDSMLYYVWNSLMTWMKTVVEVTSKKDHTDCFSFFMTSFKELVESQCIDQVRILKMFQPVVNLPEKVLASLAYQIGEKSVLTEGCPALFLTEILFNHRILEISSSQERFFFLLEKLISCGFSNESAALSFCLSVLQHMVRTVDNVESKESLWRIWSIVANPLIELIKKTNEVNQGNGMDHDFTTLYTTLTYPVLHILGDKIAHGTVKCLLKTWTDLYTTFVRQAAMVTTTETNVVCEEMCTLMLEGIKEGETMDSTYTESLVQICDVIVKQINFTEVPNYSGGLMSNFGKKSKSMGNLTSFIKLLETVLNSLGSKSQLSSQTYLTIVTSLSTLYTHIPSPTTVTAVIGKLALGTAQLLKGNCVKSQGKTFTTQFNQKIERLWLDICTSLEGRYMGPYDSDLLKDISPLLEATFIHSRRAVKTQTLSFWSSTFAKGSTLQYPESIKPILCRLREKTPIVLPGWDVSNGTTFGEMLLSQSQMTQGESQVPIPSIVSAVSPRKEFGSFMNMNVSPKVKKSPLRPQNDGPISPAKAAGDTVKKKLTLNLGLQDMNSKDFVVISTTPNRNRVLTEHQREVMKEKRNDIPAMYSSVDASMDASMMAQFCTGNSQQESQMGTNTPSVENITPFPFMKPSNPVPASKAQAEDSKQPDSSSTNSNKSKKENLIVSPLFVTPKKGRRRRSVRFSDELDTSSESMSDDKTASSKTIEEAKTYKTLPNSEKDVESQCSKRKSLTQRKKKVDVITDSDTSVEECSSSGIVRSSLRIKSRSTKSKSTDSGTCDRDINEKNKPPVMDTNSIDISTENKGDINTEKKDDILSESDSVVIIGDTECIDSEHLKHEKQSCIDDKSEDQCILNDASSQNESVTCIDSSEPLSCDKIAQKKKENEACPLDSESDSVISSQVITSVVSDQRDSSPQRKTRTSLKSKAARSPQKSHMIKSKSLQLKSPDKFKSPKKAASLEGYSTLDKWFKKSADPKAKGDEKTCQAVLNISQKSSLTKLFAQDSEESSSQRRDFTSKPIIMVEDSQQYSPKKLDKNNENSCVVSEQVSVDETPLKDMDSVIPKIDGKAVRNLHSELDTNPESHFESEVQKMSPKTQLLNDKSDSPNAEPVLKLHKLSKDELLLYSPMGKENSLFNSHLKENTAECLLSETFTQCKSKLTEKLEQKCSEMSEDIIPNSQDSFSFSTVCKTQELSEQTSKLARPFSLFSEDSKAPGNILSEDCQYNEPMDCDNIAQSPQPQNCEATAGNGSDETAVKAMREDVIEEGKVNSISDNASEIFLESQESSLKENSTNKGVIVNEEKDILSSIETCSDCVPDTSKSNFMKGSLDSSTDAKETIELLDNEDSLTGSAKKADKYRSKRKEGTPKRFDKDIFRKTLKTTTRNSEVSSTSEVVQSDSVPQTKRGRRRNSVSKKNESPKASQSDQDLQSSQPLFSSSEKVEVVEIKRKVKKIRNKSSSNNKTLIDSQVTSTQKEKISVKNKSEALTDSSDSDDNIPLDQIKNKWAETVPNKENKATEETEQKETSDKSDGQNSKLKQSSSSDEDLTLTLLVNKLPEKEAINTNKEMLPSENLHDKSDGENSKLKKNSSSDEDLPLTLLVNKLPEKEAINTNNEMLPSENLQSPILSLSSSQRGKKSVGKKRLSNMLSIDMKTSPINKKLRSSKPVLRVKLNNKTDKLKLKKPSPKRAANIILKKAKRKSSRDFSSEIIELDDHVEVKDEVSREVKDCQSDSSEKENNVEGLACPEDADFPEDEGKKVEDIAETLSQAESSNTENYSVEHVHNIESDNVAVENNIENHVSSIATLNSTEGATESPNNPKSVRASPPKKGRPFDTPETPTSSMAKTLGLTRADYIMQKSRMLLGRRVCTPSQVVKVSVKQKRSCFSEPRKAIRRTSILKNSPKSSSPIKPDSNGLFNKGSPPGTGFRPVNLPRIYSPSASPSAGILKRRRLSGQNTSDSPSPPSKQRRVSFAESVDTRLYEVPRSRLVGRPNSPKPVSRCLDMPKNVPSPLVTSEKDSQKKTLADSQLTQTPESMMSTQESQLNCKDPIFPDLQNCNDSVDLVLTQLTSSVWSRGLVELIHSKSITTIGQLCSLTEYDVNSLPIKSPKLTTMKTALKEYARKLSEKSPVNIADSLDSSIDSDPGMLETSDFLDEIKQLENETCTANKNIASSNIFTTENMTAELDSNENNVKVNKKSSDSKEGDFENKLKRQSIMNGIKSIRDLVSTKELMSLPTHSLIQIQTELNGLMSNVVTAMQSKVPLSPNSQESSQE